MLCAAGALREHSTSGRPEPVQEKCTEHGGGRSRKGGCCMQRKFWMGEKVPVPARGRFLHLLEEGCAAAVTNCEPDTVTLNSPSRSQAWNRERL